MHSIPVEYPIQWTSYELIDSGNGEKLESFSGYRIIRPDPRILWNKQKPDQWNTFDARYILEKSELTRWDIRNTIPDPWTLTYTDMRFILKPTDFKHVGIFPEQAVNWDWVRAFPNLGGKNILNLFGYTGGATIACLKAGARVTHVDSSKPSLSWAHDNVRINSIDETQTRWILDDAVKFVTREVKRMNTYDGIILDPPRFGRGTKGEVWKLTEDLPSLLSGCVSLLSDKAHFLIINAYTADISSIALDNLLSSSMQNRKGKVQSFELALQESGNGRLLPNGIVTRWDCGI